MDASKSGNFYALDIVQGGLGEVDVVVEAPAARVVSHYLPEDVGEERLYRAEVPLGAEIVQGNPDAYDAVHGGFLRGAQGAGVQRRGGGV